MSAPVTFAAARTASEMRMARFANPNYIVCKACNSAGCAHCSWWGTVRADSVGATCVHEWRRIGNVGPCLNTHQCTRCGSIKTVDSSD